MRPDTPCPRPATDTLANWPERALAHVPRTAGGGGGPHGDVMAPPHLLLPERVVVQTASLRSLLIECQRQRRFPYASVSDRHSLQEGIASGIVGVSILSTNGSPLGRNVSYMKLRVCSAERAEASSGGKPRRTRRLWRPSSISAWRAAT